MTGLRLHGDPVYVTWLDSSMRHDQVDAENLPRPAVLHTVGWLAEQGDDYVTIAREQNPDPSSYRWRSSVSIPRLAIIEIRPLQSAWAHEAERAIREELAEGASTPPVLTGEGRSGASRRSAPSPLLDADRVPEMDLPGAWSYSDFEGGPPDEVRGPDWTPLTGGSGGGLDDPTV